jgi:hypothetical protein
MTGIARAASWSVMAAFWSRAGQMSSSNRAACCGSFVAVISCITAVSSASWPNRARSRSAAARAAQAGPLLGVRLLREARHFAASGSLKPRSARLAAASAPIPE